jgi:hypothetical protein
MMDESTELRSMSSITGSLPPAQARVFAMVPAGWATMPPIGVHELILRALKERGVVETKWDGSVRKWRRVPCG